MIRPFGLLASLDPIQEKEPFDYGFSSLGPPLVVSVGTARSSVGATRSGRSRAGRGPTLVERPARDASLEWSAYGSGPH